MVTLPLSTDGPPKRQIIELAFGDLTMAGYEFGRTPEEVSDALLRLNALMYEWPYNLLGYEQPTYGSGTADSASGIPFEALNGVSAALALRIAAAMGKTLAPEARANLATAVSKIYGMTATIPTMAIAAQTPRGAGVRAGLGPFIVETVEDVNPTDEV